MYTYRNKNTGHTVTSESKWGRLEALPNWERTSGPADKPEQSPDPVDGGQGGDTAVKRPSQNASKDDWVLYAVEAHGLDVEVAEGMTKQQLIAYEPPADGGGEDDE